MGETNLSYEQQAKQHWNTYFSELGITRAKDMIAHINANPQIGKRIVDDVIAGMNKDKETT